MKIDNFISILLLSDALLLVYFPHMGILWRLSWITTFLFLLTLNIFSMRQLFAALAKKEAELSALQKEYEHEQTLLKSTQIVIKELQKARLEKETVLQEMGEKMQTLEAALLEQSPTDVQLKQKLEERTRDLIAARKDLLKLEGEHVALQKEQGGEDPSLELLFSQIKELEEERKGLEAEVLHLEEIISTLMPKKKAPRAKKAAQDHLVQLLF